MNTELLIEDDDRIGPSLAMALEEEGCTARAVPQRQPMDVPPSARCRRS
ncbi:hypothetical protein OHA21_15060 [Actinoplanes sp. NBC_00393]